MVFADPGIGTLVQGARFRIASFSISAHTALGTQLEWTGHTKRYCVLIALHHLVLALMVLPLLPTDHSDLKYFIEMATVVS